MNYPFRASDRVVDVTIVSKYAAVDLAALFSPSNARVTNTALHK